MKKVTFAFAVLAAAGAFGGNTYPVTDVASLTAALGQAGDGDVVECAANTYLLSAQVNLTAAVTLRGAGVGKTILKSANSKASMRILTLANPNAVVENLTLDGGFLKGGNGAGAYVTAGTLQDCEIRNCSEDHWDGVLGCGVHATGSESLVLRCDIHDNTAIMGQGMGLGLTDNAVAKFCLIRDNVCTSYATHSVYIKGCGTLENCTVARNVLVSSGAVGTSTVKGDMPVVTNCVVWGNMGDTPLVASSSVFADGWTIQGLLSYVSNTTADDPDFLDYGQGDFRLDAASPCIAAGQGCYPFDTTAVTCGVFTVTRETVVGETVVFTAGVFNCSGDYAWDFGDGTPSVTTTEPTVSHVYASYGTFDVGLSVGGTSCLRRNYVQVRPKTMYVNFGNANPVSPYATRETAAKYVEDALEVAVEGGEIVVLAGTHQMRGAAPITIAGDVTVRGETGVREDVTILKRAGADQVFYLNHAQARVESLTADGNATKHSNGNNKLGGCFRLGALGGTVSNCVMRGIAYSEYGDRGGGVCMDAGLVTHCVISNNAVNVSSGGSGVFMTGGTVSNCLIARNRIPSAGNYGGAVRMSAGGTLVNCTIVGNTAGSYPSVSISGDKSKVKVINCLFAENVSSNVEGDWPCVCNSSSYSNCFTACAAPFLINDTCFTGALGLKSVAGDDFHLVIGSDCTDKATKVGVDVPATDLDGNPRLDDSGKLDIGCYELTFDGVQASIMADVDTPTSALAPFSVTYRATVVGADPTTLVYRWDVYGDGSEIVETQVPTATLTYSRYGSFKAKLVVVKGGEGYPAVNDVDATSYPPVHYVDVNNTTPAAPYDTPAKAATDLGSALAASYSGAEIVVATGRYPLSGQVAIEKGVTVRGETGNPEDVVFCRANPKGVHRLFSLNNAKVTLCSLTMEGGALSDSNSEGANVRLGLSGGTVSNCVIRNGSSIGYNACGGGVCIVADAQNAVVTHCVITNNEVSTGGSALARVGGAGVRMYAGIVRNSLVAYNYQTATETADAPFGGVLISGGVLENCTIAANRARICGGVNALGGTVRNCVIAGNESTVSDDPNLAVWATSSDPFDHCLSPVKINGSCLVQAQPFAAPSIGDFSLCAGSLGIDAAAPLDWMPGTLDLAGNDRVRDAGPDIGAYEADGSAFSASFAADVSEGFAPLTVTFEVTAVNAGEQGVSCAWSVDGKAAGSSCKLTFERTFAVGDHTVVLTVTDVDSGTTYAVPGFVRIYSAPKVMYVAPANGSVTSVYPYATRETAATNVRHAVDAAISGTEIVLLRGRHQTTGITYLNAPVTVRGETGRPEDVVLADSSRASRVFNLNNGAALVRDLAIEGTAGGSRDSMSSQCVYFEAGGGIVSNCILRGCAPNAYNDVGGAVYMASDDAVLTHCVLSNNTIGCTGGRQKGIAVAIAKGRMENCLVAYNSSDNTTDTTKDSNGGAVYLTGGTMVNCTVFTNTHQGCAGVYADGGTVANCLVVGNVSTLAGGDASVWRGDADGFSRCLGEVRINDSCLTGSTEVFREARIKKGVFIPLGGSAARDAGDNAFVSEATDLYGNPRVYGGKVDLGCAESKTGGMTLLAR